MKTDHSDLSINGESMSKVRNRRKGTRPSVTIFIELLRTLTVPAPEFLIVQCFWQFRSIRFEFGNADQYYLFVSGKVSGPINIVLLLAFQCSRISFNGCERTELHTMN